MEQIIPLGNVSDIVLIAFLGFWAVAKVVEIMSKRKKGNGDVILSKDDALLKAVNTIGENHMHDIEKAITSSNAEIVRAINENGKILSKIEGLLNK